MIHHQDIMNQKVGYKNCVHNLIQRQLSLYNLDCGNLLLLILSMNDPTILNILHNLLNRDEWGL